MISAIVISFYDHNYIKECISSLAFVDDIIIVGKIDSVVLSEIEHKNPVQFIESETLDFDFLFEKTYSKASHDWIVVLEANHCIPVQLAEEITEIVDLLLNSLNKRLEDRKVTVVFTDAAKKWIGEKGYDPTYGARPLKRFLQKQVETQLARALVAGEVEEGSEVAFSVKDDELVMKVG